MAGTGQDQRRRDRVDAEPQAARDAHAAQGPEAEPEDVQTAFQASVGEGTRRLERSLPALLATGFVGGVDVSVGVFGLIVVEDLTDSKILGSLAFGIGFIALTVAKSELFTENFLVPISALVARREGIGSLLRLWGGTAAMNLVGGWVVAAIVMAGFPDLNDSAVELGRHFVEIGIGWRSFAMAMVGGVIITLMTWMIEATRSQGARMVSAVSAAFLLAAGEINHSIVASLEMFAGLLAGAPYGYLDWLWMFLWASLGNVVGGIGLVTILRFVQVGGGKVREEQAKQRRVLDERRAAGR
jgi:formate/nitrite transporter FocA (FNT family)